MDRALSWFFRVWVALVVAINLCILPSLPLRAAEKNTQLISDAIYLKPQRLVEVKPGRRLNVYRLGHGSPTVIFDSGLWLLAVSAHLHAGDYCFPPALVGLLALLVSSSPKMPHAGGRRPTAASVRCKLNAPAIV